MGLSLAQYALQTQSDMAQGLVQIVTNESIFLKRLRFMTVSDFSFSYNRQQTLGGIAFRGINQTYTDDVGVVNPEVETLKIFGGSIKTDRLLATKTIRANNVAAKLKRAGLFFDKYVLQGSSQASPLQFDGLNIRLTGNQVKSAGANGGSLTLALLDNLLDAVVGPNSKKILVMNKTLRTKLKQLILAAAGGAAVAEFKNGELDTYNGAQIEVIDEDGDDQVILGFTETQGTSNITSSVYCIRMGELDNEFMHGLLRKKEGSNGGPIEYVDYGERNGNYDELVEGVMGIALFHPRSAARLKGVLAT